MDCSHPKLVFGLVLSVCLNFAVLGLVIYSSFRINTIKHDVERLKAVQVSQSKISQAVDLLEIELTNIISMVMTSVLVFLHHFPLPVFRYIQ